MSRPLIPCVDDDPDLAPLSAFDALEVSVGVEYNSRTRGALTCAPTVMVASGRIELLANPTRSEQ